MKRHRIEESACSGVACRLMAGVSLFLAVFGLLMSVIAQSQASVNVGQEDARTHTVSVVTEINAGVVFSGTPRKISLPLVARIMGADKTITGVTTSCDCLVLQSKLPLDIADKGATTLEFSYIPRELGEWNVEVVLQLVGPGGMENRSLLLYGSTCDPEWRVDATEAIAASQTGKVQLIDLRGSAAWQQVCALGAVPMSSGELLRNRSLKKRNIILIGENLTDDPALNIAAQLHQKEFSRIRVLSGGLSAWVGAGGTLEGSAINKAHAIAPMDLMSGPVPENTRIVYLGIAPTASTDANALQLPTDTNSKELSARLEAFPKQRFILVSSDGNDAWILLEKLPPALRARTLYLDGGQQALMAQAKTQSGVGQNLPPVTIQSGSRLMLARSGSCGGCGRK